MWGKWTTLSDGFVRFEPMTTRKEVAYHGSFISASDQIDQAADVWTSGDAADATAMSALLDTLNNSHCEDIDACVLTIPFNPCLVVY